MWTLPRWGEDGHVNGTGSERGRANSSSEDDENENGDTRAEAGNGSKVQSASKDPTSTDFFAALKAAKDAGPMPAHIKPLKRLALMSLADFTLSGAREVAFGKLRATLHACLHQPLLDQMFETNRLRDHFRQNPLQ